jgi:CHAT domain-containing protein
MSGPGQTEEDQVPIVREITISVTRHGEVEARRDDDAPAGPKTMKSAGLEADLIRMFERWLSERDRVWRRDEITVIGRLLYQMLLEGEVGDFVQETLDSLGRDDRLRLRLEFAADGSDQFRHLPAVPWEYLYYPDRPNRAGFFLATDPRLILCRYLKLKAGQGEFIKSEDTSLRLLTVVAQPDDPYLGEVIYEPVLKVIEGLATGLPISIDTVRDPTLNDLEDALRAHQPHILHFMGHGDYAQDKDEGRIALLGDDGGARWVSDRDFVETLQHARAIPRLVVLHSCDGGRVDYRANFAGMAPQLIRNGVQCVVAMQYAVTNQVAIAFSTAFYRHLSAGAPVDEAVQEGRWRITRSDGVDDNGPRLLGVPVVYLYSRDAIIKPGGGAASPPTKDDTR